MHRRTILAIVFGTLISPQTSFFALGNEDVDDSETPLSPETIEAIKQTRNELNGLFLELQEFRNSSEFRSIGFDECCRYGNWLKRASRFAVNPDRNIQWELNVKFGAARQSLLELADHYRKDAGRESEETKYCIGRIKKALARED